MKGIDIDEVLRSKNTVGQIIEKDVERRLIDLYREKVWVEGEFDLPEELKDEGIALTEVAHVGVYQDLYIYEASNGKYYIGNDDEKEGVLVEIKQRDEEDEIEDEYEV